MVEYGGEMYRYVHNLQGDIVGILDASGNLVVEYKYDAWGKPISTTGDLSSTLGALNPFRYRGYVYDQETQLYYLRSRYYRPELSRFISGDGMIYPAIMEVNAFTYCKNNPVVVVDYWGCSGYYVIINLYSTDYLPTGHYDISFISKDGNKFKVKLNDKEHWCDGFTLSYGGENGDESRGIVTAYSSAVRHDTNGVSPRSYILYDDLSEEAFDAFVSWFTNDFAEYSKGSKTSGKSVFKVKDVRYSWYSIANKNYCGTGLVEMLLHIPGMLDKDKNDKYLEVFGMSIWFNLKPQYFLDEYCDHFSQVFNSYEWN